MDTEEKQPYTLSMDKIKECIGSSPDDPIAKTLTSLCDCWYGIAIQEGKSEQEALRYTLDQLGEKMLSMSS